MTDKNPEIWQKPFSSMFDRFERDANNVQQCVIVKSQTVGPN